ncbi:hypothetical protein GCM10009548_21450 [Streptomyces malaysiensis subsp. malaysiensis]
MEIPGWSMLLVAVLTAIAVILKRTPAVFREARKVANAYYDLRDDITRRRRQLREKDSRSNE